VTVLIPTIIYMRIRDVKTNQICGTDLSTHRAKDRPG